jgi:hypothetical protein
MGKSPKLPDKKIEKVRDSNRKLIKKHKDLNAAVQDLIKKEGKPKNEDERSRINRKAYKTIIRRNPLLLKAVKENVARARPK